MSDHVRHRPGGRTRITSGTENLRRACAEANLEAAERERKRLSRRQFHKDCLPLYVFTLGVLVWIGMILSFLYYSK